MPLKDTGSDFASVLNAAMRSPEPFSEAGRDLPDGFPLPPNEMHRVVDTNEQGIPGLVAFDFKVHRKVFTIFRPWENCARCTADMASGLAAPPTDGDYACPHVNLGEYEAVVNDVLSGKLLFGSEQEIPQKDGSVLVSLRWYEKIAKKKKQQRPGVDGTTPEAPL